MDKRRSIVGGTKRRTSLGPSDTNPTVFVHSSWRTSGTWLWTCFRRNPATYSYREIFHETFASLSKARIPLIGPKSWNSRHPKAAQYFLEFGPLIEAKGQVAHYSESMAFRTFIPADGPYPSEECRLLSEKS